MIRQHFYKNKNKIEGDSECRAKGECLPVGGGVYGQVGEL